MQRASASSPTQSTASSSRTPASEPFTKRRRLDPQSQPTTPSPSVRNPNGFATRSGSTAEEEALIRAHNRREGDETEWVLKINLPTAETSGPTVNGHSHREDDVDDGDDVWADETVGRQTYGSFSRKKAQAKPDESKEEDALSSASDSDGSSGSVKPKRRSAHYHRHTDRPTPTQAPTRSAQAPKRFFDQIPRDAKHDKDTQPAKQRDKKQRQRKKP